MILIDPKILLIVVGMILLFILFLCICLSWLIWQAYILKKSLLEGQKQADFSLGLEQQFTDKLNNLSDEYLERSNQIAQKQSKVFEETLQNLLQSSANSYSNVSKDIEKQEKDNLNKSYEKMEQEIEEEKEKRLKELEQKIALASKKIVEDILERSVSSEEHEKLVMDALEKAKKQGIFR